MLADMRVSCFMAVLQTIRNPSTRLSYSLLSFSLLRSSGLSKLMLASDPRHREPKYWPCFEHLFMNEQRRNSYHEWNLHAHSPNFALTPDYGFEDIVGDSCWRRCKQLFKLSPHATDKILWPVLPTISRLLFLSHNFALKCNSCSTVVKQFYHRKQKKATSLTQNGAFLCFIFCNVMSCPLAAFLELNKNNKFTISSHWAAKTL